MKVPKRICFLSALHQPRDKRVFDKEAVFLAAEGHRVIHLCPGSPEESGVFQGVHIITYPKPCGIWARVKQMCRLYGLARRQKADVYHCNEVDSWFIGVLLHLRGVGKCVFDVHEHYPSAFAESRFPKRLQPMVSRLVRIGFCLMTPFTYRFVLAKKTVSKDFPVSAKRKVLARNFVPLNAIRIEKARQMRPQDMPATIVHLGLFSKARGWPQVLKSLTLMRNKQTRLLVIGEIHDGTQDEFLDHIQQNDLQDRIELKNWMPFSEVFPHLCRADIGLIAFQPGIQNHVYAMPHKMFDYMAAGLAVVCPDFAEEVAPLIKETGCGVLVDPADPQALADQLDDLVENPAKTLAMGSRGRKAVLDRYNWDVEFRSLSEMYAVDMLPDR